jgi:hypothetical protein
MAIRPITLAFIKSRCRIDPRTECWDWANYITKSGYGRMSIDGVSKWVHRVVWELVNGAISPRKRVYHDCDNRTCCNPEHLLCGTQLQIIRAAKSKGRLSSGVRHSLATTPRRRARSDMTMAKARQIRRACAAGTSQRAASKKFKVSRFTVQSIVTRKTWRENANIFGL